MGTEAEELPEFHPQTVIRDWGNGQAFRLADATAGVCAFGATGSGKSSIVSLIARFYQPQSGRVLVDGYDIRYATGDSLHKQMGLVLQVNYLFTGSVMENIRYAVPGATEEDVINAAKAIGSHDAIMGLQDGYQTEVGGCQQSREHHRGDG